MIVTVTPNPAVDVTYGLDALRPGQVHRVRTVTTRAGGKGVNVARVLARLGSPCAAVGLGSGPDADAVVAELDAIAGALVAWAIERDGAPPVDVVDRHAAGAHHRLEALGVPRADGPPPRGRRR